MTHGRRSSSSLVTVPCAKTLLCRYILQVQTLRYFDKQSSFSRYSRNSKSHPAWFTQSLQLTNSAITLFRINTCVHLENALVYQNIHFMSRSVQRGVRKLEQTISDSANFKITFAIYLIISYVYFHAPHRRGYHSLINIFACSGNTKIFFATTFYYFMG